MEVTETNNMDHVRGSLEHVIKCMYDDIMKRTGYNVLDRTTLVDAMMKFMESHLEHAYQLGMNQRVIVDAREKATSGKYRTCGGTRTVEAQQFTDLMMEKEEMRQSWPKGVVENPYMMSGSWGYDPNPVVMMGKEAEYVMPGDWIVVDGDKITKVHPYRFKKNYIPVEDSEAR